jgi:electron transfer flavoprotein beta subunit
LARVVADHLHMPSLTQVIKLDVAAAGPDGAPALRCERQAEYGYDTVEVDLPAVIAVGDAINEPRYPSLKAIMGAKKKPLDTFSADDVGIDRSRVGAEHSAARWVARSSPRKRPSGRSSRTRTRI